jgi:predicted HNH restriction endonuclease
MTIEKLLNGIGIKIFVTYFQYFNDNNLDTSDIIEILPNSYTEKSRRSRISKARTIISNNRLQEALNYILNSTRVDEQIKEKAQNILDEKQITIIYPDDIEDNNLFEGTKKEIIVNAYERSSKARKECIERYGYKCTICKFDFEKIYGEIGKNFIHVHHIKPLSEIDEKYKIDPIEDLRPVCPNCHAMLHKRIPAYSINEIVNLIDNKDI